MTTLETVIIYAGVMKYLTSVRTAEIDPLSPRIATQLVSPVPELERFHSIRKVLTNEMQDVLFELLEVYIMMERQKLLGVVPVLKPYRRLPQLFYILSGTQELYYTIEDKLIKMNPILSRKKRVELETQHIRDAATTERKELRIRIETARKGKDGLTDVEIDALNADITLREESAVRSITDDESATIKATEKEIRELEAKGPDLTGVQRERLVRLKRENAIRIAEQARNLYSRGSSNDIKHRELTELTVDERTTLLASEANLYISLCQRQYAALSIKKYTIADIGTKSTALSTLGEMAPIFNFCMSIEETFERAKNRSGIDKRGVAFKPYDRILKHYIENSKSLFTLPLNKKNEEAIAEAHAALETLTAEFAEQIALCAPDVKALANQEARRIWLPIADAQ